MLKIFQAYIIDVLHEILQITQNFINIEFALRYGILELPRHEKIPETHVLAAWLLNGKKDLCCQISTSYFRIFRFLEMCVTQV